MTLLGFAAIVSGAVMLVWRLRSGDDDDDDDEFDDGAVVFFYRLSTGDLYLYISGVAMQ